jgi:hypothetical protein
MPLYMPKNLPRDEDSSYKGLSSHLLKCQWPDRVKGKYKVIKEFVSPHGIKGQERHVFKVGEVYSWWYTPFAYIEQGYMIPV